ncbi:16823_t:CDS:2, partial [Cetraspora pellucida]
INNYLHNYANIYGFPSPGRNIKNNAMPIISLPTDITYTSVYEAYISTIKSNKEDNYKHIAYITFTQIWHEVAPDIRFMTKASDLCDRCEQLCIKIRVAKDVESKQKYQGEYDLHQAAATIERQHYNESIDMTVVNESTKEGSNIAIRYDLKNQTGWNYYDFEIFLEPHFVKYDGIRAFRHFYFYSNKPGKVFMSLESNGQKKQLYKDIHPYVHDPYKDELCFASH